MPAPRRQGARPLASACDVWIMGELLVEIMRPRAGMTLGEQGTFLGPFPSGAPGIFIDTVARLGHSAAIVSGVGDDDFGRCILDRLQADGVNTDLVQVIPGRSTAVAFVTYFEDGSRKFIFHWDGTPAVMARVPDPDARGSTRSTSTSWGAHSWRTTISATACSRPWSSLRTRAPGSPSTPISASSCSVRARSRRSWAPC